MDAEHATLWEHFKREHPPGSSVIGVVKSRHSFGVYFDLGVPFDAFADYIYMNRTSTEPFDHRRDLPAPGERVSMFVLKYAEVPREQGDNVRLICLSQGPSTPGERYLGTQRERGRQP